MQDFLQDQLELGDRPAVSGIIQDELNLNKPGARSLGEYLFSILRAAGRSVESLRPIA